MAKEIKIGPVENHRGREGGALVYPVYSRRSRGLSVGVNLFPDKKICSFDCPYCEVFPFKTDIRFSPDVMEEALRDTLVQAKADSVPVRDICFSGSGEPTLSPEFPAALEAAARLRDQCAPEAVLVVITNGTGLLNERTFDFLRRAASGSLALNIWLKLDAGTPDWYARMDRSNIPYDELMNRIRDFAALAPCTIQTMLCAVDGKAPPPEEAAAWVRLVTELAAAGNIRGVQLYGKARPAPEDPAAERLPATYLEERAAILKVALGRAAVPVTVFP
jgi:histidinol dehydrogenase